MKQLVLDDFASRMSTGTVFRECSYVRVLNGDEIGDLLESLERRLDPEDPSLKGTSR